MASCLGNFELGGIHDPVLVAILDLLAFGLVVGGQQRTPGLGVDHIRILAGFGHAILAVDDLEVGAGDLRLFLGLLDDLGHELELGRISQGDIHAEARHLENERLRQQRPV